MLGRLDRPSRLRMVGQYSCSADNENHGLPIFTAAFAQRTGSIFCSCDEEGNVTVVDTETGGSQGHVRHADSIFDIQFSRDDKQLLLASADEFVYIRETEDLSGNPLMCLGHHQGSVKSARWRPSDPNVILSAGRDGDVAVWDLRTAGGLQSHTKPIGVYSNIHKRAPNSGRKSGPTGEQRSGIVQADFLPGQDHVFVTIGQPDHAIKFWDIRYKWGTNASPIPVDQIRLPGEGIRERAFTSLAFDPLGSSLYAANANNRIYAYGMSNFASQPLRVFEAPEYESGSFFVKLAVSPDGDYLASGSLQDSTYIWSAHRQGSCFKIGGHFKEVTAVAWTRDQRGHLGLLSCGEDGSINMWSENDAAPELVGCGRPSFVEGSSADAHSASTLDPWICSEEIPELEPVPDRPDPSDLYPKENVRPATPPNLLIPPATSSLRSTCKKPVISDYFRPVGHGTSVTDHLLSSHKASPHVNAPPSAGLKRYSALFAFGSSPLRPVPKRQDSSNR